MVASESGQLTAVALAEALELTLVDDWETVDEAEDDGQDEDGAYAPEADYDGATATTY